MRSTDAQATATSAATVGLLTWRSQRGAGMLEPWGKPDLVKQCVARSVELQQPAPGFRQRIAVVPLLSIALGVVQG